MGKPRIRQDITREAKERHSPTIAAGVLVVNQIILGGIALATQQDIWLYTILAGVVTVGSYFLAWWLERFWHTYHTIPVERYYALTAKNVELEIINSILGTYHHDAVLWLWLRLTNRGEPSSFHSWRSEVGDGAIGVKDFHTTEPYYFSLPHETYMVSPDQLIYAKTVAPVPKGGIVNGVLPLRLNCKPDVLEKRPTKLKISCVDAWGNSIELEAVVGSAFPSRMPAVAGVIVSRVWEPG